MLVFVYLKLGMSQAEVMLLVVTGQQALRRGTEYELELGLEA